MRREGASRCTSAACVAVPRLTRVHCGLSSPPPSQDGTFPTGIRQKLSLAEQYAPLIGANDTFPDWCGARSAARGRRAGGVALRARR